jgi:hypothetical protein
MYAWSFLHGTRPADNQSDDPRSKYRSTQARLNSIAGKSHIMRRLAAERGSCDQERAAVDLRLRLCRLDVRPTLLTSSYLDLAPGSDIDSRRSG